MQYNDNSTYSNVSAGSFDALGSAYCIEKEARNQIFDPFA
jgi:hypothetical protein